MSQADAARITGDPIVVGGKSASSTVSRRAALTAVMLTGFAPIALALPIASPPADHAFWADHRRWTAIDQEWQAALDATAGDGEAQESTFDRYASLELAARQAVLLRPVTTAAALLAKLTMVDAAVDIDTGDDDYPDFWACLVRDVMGMAA
ncbi:hypothetical protein [Sphingobium sp. WCS2017Hpa-17]|uniref:hypothetical protein n=1 Tax=Sphingobium sp. WCS2017Hpa-17 TaxID=3073638 RepID=UPI00288BFC8A|nr:hypothetical protein [Sphingobium sp. WCS2017Hpa-17]